MSATASAQVIAAAADAPDDSAAVDPTSEIIVTGTRRTDRTVTESAVPVDVFTAKDLSVQASPSLQTILKNLVPSFNQQRNAGADGSAFVRPPTLRGLPPDQILVLINGKRMHRSALVQVAGDSLSAGSQGPDLSQIPAVALGRIEVLRDGAAAQYGSDAIAGVINLGLRTNDSGYEVNARYGQTYEGDGKDIQVSANAGFKLGEGFVNLSAEFNDQGLFNRALDRPDAAPLRAAGIDVPSPSTRYGQPESRSYRFVINSAIPVGDKDEVYFFGNYGFAKQEVDFNYRRPFAVSVTPGAAAVPGAVPAASFTLGESIGPIYLDTIPGLRTASGAPVYNANGRIFRGSTFFPNGFTPLFKSDNEDYSGVIGYRGETAFGMNFDFSAGTGRNRISYDMTNTLNPSLGPQSPTSFFLGRLEQRETNINLDLSYPVEVGFFSPLNIAGGLEFRRETYAVGIGDPASYAIGPYASQTVQRTDGTRFVVNAALGANGFPGYSPDAATENSRTSYSAYVDLEADVAQDFTIGIAGRYDHFSDFGGTVNGKVSARWAIDPAIAVRGAVSTGFRAPTPGQSATANVQTAFPNGSVVPVAVATVRADSVTGIYFGSQPLDPEKSLSFSGGFVLTPGSGFTGTFDYYNIAVRSRIAITSSFNVTPADRVALAALGVVNAADLGQVNYFTNGFKTKTQGVDAVLSHRASVSAGVFNTSLAVNYNSTDVTERTIPAAIDVRRSLNIEGLSPKWRGVLAESWTSGMFDATARLNYYGSITSYNDNPNAAWVINPASIQEFGADWSFDLEVGVTFDERFRVAAGAENLFNRYPDRDVRNLFSQTGAAANGRIYNDASPLSYMGGFWYLRASAKF
ncbi:TonB-dependent receptor [Polymorphobacter glacialis]|uniref:TonB-dependent receptor n=1 Tax=Sandarakinorhabdus glacialis TaxID=1614636 RepID=A0A916ZUM4_9SPHN|nr:TonB-dependent receptor [Polymorphobacter glacialis]GGE12302.1 TonB-dependent receptor [Polymorphobacter glacialis]